MSFPQFHTLTIVLLLTAICSSTSVIAQEQATLVDASETWLRQQVQISGADLADVELRVWGTGVTSVYLNGQRLLRNQTVNGLTIWKVGPLLRTGDNCIALAMAPSESERLLKAGLTGLGNPTVEYAPWKTTTAVPPVGWQSTDFNDRDWNAAQQKPVDPAAAAELNDSPATHLSWATDNSTHIQDGRFSFRDGDHVVLLGGTFIERAQQYGYLECALNTAANVTFRNLGWSADTVFAESRGIFDSPAKGYERMIEHVRAEEPTVVLVCYGQNEALSFAAGPAGIARFKAQLKTLHRDLTASGAEVVFLTPHPFVTLSPPLPDAAQWNARLQQYSAAVTEVAADLSALAVDLNTNFVRDMAMLGSSNLGTHLASQQALADPEEHPELTTTRNSLWTDNGMHWNADGYQQVALLVASRLLGPSVQQPLIVIDADAKTVTTTSGQIQNINWPADETQRLTFEYQPHRLTASSVSLQWKTATIAQPVLAIDAANTDDSDFEKLRRLVIRKNELYFHRWRPQNITYLLGFRKHEQGNNASDIAKFDPLIEELERQIAAARRLNWQTITVKIPQ